MFCSKCGTLLPDEAKFCFSCGTSTGIVPNHQKADPLQIYNGKIIKCPFCGNPLDSLSITCPACGNELRESQSSTSIQEFTSRLMNAKTTDSKISLVQNFPIPNTKEDILEFMILTSSNYSACLADEQPHLKNAWQTKMNQCLLKSDILLKGDPLLKTIHQIYDNLQIQEEASNKQHNKKRVKNFISKNIGICIGLLLIIIGFIMESIGYSLFWENFNSSSHSLTVFGETIKISGLGILLGSLVLKIRVSSYNKYKR